MTARGRWIRATTAGGAATLAAAALLTPAAGATSGGASTSYASFFCSSAYSTQKKNGPTDTVDTLHFRCTVRDLAKDGHGVYLQYKGYRNGPIPNTGWNRLTSNVSGKGQSATFTGTGKANTINDWKIRVCRQISGRDDDCSGTLAVDA